MSSIIHNATLRHAFPAAYNKASGLSFNEFVSEQRARERREIDPYGRSADLRNLEIYKPLKPNPLDDYAKAKENERRVIRRKSKWVKVQQPF